MPGLADTTALHAALPALFAPAAPHATIGLAVSGGADSLALMLLAARWAAGRVPRPRLIVYSLDHGLRPEAAGEVTFVLGEAAQLGIEARGLVWRPAPSEPRGQAAARAARYRLIGTAMRADGATLLLTGHHLGDQAETVLMRLAHGSGLDGLRGMMKLAKVEDIAVGRPLLEVPQSLLQVVVYEAGIAPVADPSNTDPHYERVRWRQALPGLAELGLDAATLAAFSRRAGEADDAIGEWADSQFSALVTIDPLGAMSLSAPALAGLPRAVGIKLLLRLVALAGGGQKAGALGPVERLYGRLIDGAPLPGLTLFGAGIRRRGDTLWFSREAGRLPPSRIELRRGEGLLWDRRFRIGNQSQGTVSVSMAGAVSRRAAALLVGAPVVAPAAAIRSAPLVMGQDGAVLALGEHRLSELIAINFERR